MPTQLDVAVHGVTLRLRVWPAADPSRPPVVFLPATAETAEDWDAVASALHSSRKVYAVNLRGHGPSDWPGTYSIQAMADDVTGLLRQLGGGPVDLVGHSLGGLVACTVASAHQELLSRLVLEDVGLLHPRPAAMPARRDGVAGVRLADGRAGASGDRRSRPAVARRRRAISAPTLVIAGGPSSPVPRTRRRARPHAPGRQVVTVDAGHLVHAKRPEEFTQHLQAFLDGR